MYFRLFYKILTILSLMASSEPSRVIDSSVTKGLYVTDYCPFMKGCAKPGIHVMCLKNPNVVNWFGPHCHEAKNITVTDQIALRLLTIVNAIRRKVALGIEKGKDGRYFPRGYGIWKLQWDSELATFAQVWANQCVFHRDYCRSTDRFPNPSQSLGLVRFTYPDWKPITTSWPGTGFQPQIIVHAVIQTVKKWYTLKSTIGVDEIDSLSTSGVSKPYLNMVSSDVTHMGCGISAFTEYSYNAQDVDLLFNSVLLVCNFSARLVAGTPVYNTTPPTSPDYSTKCGCPPGSKEDDDCLCSLSDDKNCTGSHCKPTVVLLPIFTVEDAPPGKIPKRFKNVTRAKESMEVYKLFQNLGFNNSKEVFQYNKMPRFYQKPEVLQQRKRQETTTKENDLNGYSLRRNNMNKTKSSNSCSKPKPKIKYNEINPTKQVYGVNIGIRRKVLNKNKYNKKGLENITAHKDAPDKISLLQAYNDSTDNKIADLLDKLEKAVNNVELDGHKKHLFDEKIKKIYGEVLKKIPNSANRERYSKVRSDYEDVIRNKINANPYHDLYLENDELGHRQNDGVTKKGLIDIKENDNPYVDEYLPNTYIDSNPAKRPVLGAKDKRKHDNFVVKNRVVKDDALDVNRRMYYQTKLNELRKSVDRDYASKSPRYEGENSGTRRMRPTIN